MSALPTAADVACPVCGTGPAAACVNTSDGTPAEHQSRAHWADYIARFRPFVAVLTTPTGELPAGTEVEVRKLPTDMLLITRSLPGGEPMATEIPLDGARYDRLAA